MGSIKPVSLLILLIFAGLMVQSCASSGAGVAPADNPALSGFPPPSQIVRAASVTDGARIREGDKYIIGTQHNTAADAGGESFNPLWSPGNEDLDHSAYAVYKFPLEDYMGDPEILFEWNTAPPPAGNIWIGLSNFDIDGWNWFSYPPGNVYTYNPSGPHFSGAGDLLIALVVTGDVASVLDYIRIGPDVAPICGIDPDVPAGYPPLAVTLTAWGFDIDGTITKFEFDTGDGTWNDNGLTDTYLHTYTDPGQYIPRVRVTDNFGNQAIAETQVGCSWQHSWGSASYENGRFCAITSDGGVVVLGLTTGFGQGANEILMVKYSAAGIIQWQKTFGSPDGDDPVAMVIDETGNMYVAGYTLNGVDSRYDPIVFKLDSAGTLLEQKIFYLTGSSRTVDAAMDSAGNLYVLCSLDKLSGESDLLALKFSMADLSLTDSATWDGGFDDQAAGLVVNPAGNLFIAGHTDSFSTGHATDNSILISLDPELGERWAKVYGKDQDAETTNLSLSNQKLFLSASNRIIRTNINGDIEFQREFTEGGGFFYILGLTGKPDGGCFATGTHFDPFIEADLLLLDSEFNLVFNRSFGLPNKHDELYSAVPDGTGALYIAGRGPDNTGSWAEYTLTPSDPGFNMFDGTGVALVVSTPGTVSPWTGVLSNVLPGSETQDTGGGGDDMVVLRYFPE